MTEGFYKRYKLFVLTGISIAALLCILFLVRYFYNERNRIEVFYEENGDLDLQNEGINSKGMPKDSVFEHSMVLIPADSIPVKLAFFPDNEFYKDHRNWISYWFDHVDKDTIPEFIVSYFTGGAHCCDNYSIFRKTAENSYQIMFNYISGSGSLTIENRLIKLSFSEQTGYFFTCYACDIFEELPDSTFEPIITLKYNGNNFDVLSGDEKLNQSIISNLEYLAARPIPEMDSSDMDDGTRKAFARHIISWHFNNYADINATKALFEKYYKAGDAAKVWDEMDANIQSVFGMEYSNSQYINKIIKTMESFKE